MSQPVSKPRKSKRDAPPEVIIQEAVPIAPTKDQDTQMERLSALPLTPETIPDGMKSESRLYNESIYRHNSSLEEAQQNQEMVNRMLKIGTLAAGIGLGILICSKGYKYMFPAVDKAVEAIVEETTQ